MIWRECPWRYEMFGETAESGVLFKGLIVRHLSWNLSILFSFQGIVLSCCGRRRSVCPDHCPAVPGSGDIVDAVTAGSIWSDTEEEESMDEEDFLHVLWWLALRWTNVSFLLFVFSSKKNKDNILTRVCRYLLRKCFHRWYMYNKRMESYILLRWKWIFVIMLVKWWNMEVEICILQQKVI